MGEGVTAVPKAVFVKQCKIETHRDGANLGPGDGHPCKVGARIIVIISRKEVHGELRAEDERVVEVEVVGVRVAANIQISEGAGLDVNLIKSITCGNPRTQVVYGDTIPCGNGARPF